MKQLKIRVYGIVQGVGFRPFVSRLAAAGGLRGTVCNKGSYVEILVQGESSALMRFQKDLKNLAPERSGILKMDVTEQALEPFADFRIIKSKKRSGDIFVSPDIAICPTCKTELFDKNNRRYLHPFINCTACGPRLTILKQMPYDRSRTTMSEFAMCPQCASEYETMGDRRYDGDLDLVGQTVSGNGGRCRRGSCCGGLGSLGLREDLAHQDRQEDDAGKAHECDAHTHDNNKCAGNLHRRIRSFYVFWRYYSAQNLHINRLEALLALA